MHRTLIVARLDPANAPKVAAAFAESDAGELPHRLGVAHRQLFLFHDLYFHMVDSPVEGLSHRVAAVRDNPIYQGLNTVLAQYVTAYDPATWRSPADAMADPFYSWSAPAHHDAPPAPSRGPARAGR